MTIGYEYHPGSLYLNVTNRCSNDCTFCVRQGSDSLAGFSLRLAREPDAAAVLADIAAQEQRRGAPFDEVVFCGYGEPTYRLDLIGVVGAVLRARGVHVRLNTNGQAALLGGSDPLPTLEGAIDEISISLNAPDATSYERLCQPSFGPKTHDAVVDFARRCVGRIGRVTLTVVGSVLDSQAIDRCRRIAEELGAEFRVR